MRWLVLACVRSLPGASRALQARPGLVRRSLAVVPVVGGARSQARARARAASSPWVGARTNAATNSAVCSSTMIPPVAPSRK